MHWWVLRKRLHRSWLVAAGCVGVLVGVWLARFDTHGFFAPYYWYVMAGAVGVIGIWRERRFMVPIVVIAGVVIGLTRGATSEANMQFFGRLDGQTVLSGTLTDDPDTGSDGTLGLRLGTLRLGSTPVDGAAWVSVVGGAAVQRGDIVTVRGQVGSGFGSFAATMYRASVEKIVVPQPGDVALTVRDWFAGLVRRAIPDPQASLGLGYLLGQKRALPTELAEAFVTVGLTHVVVASGYNLTILVRLARRLFMRVSKYFAALMSGAMILSFMAVTGASPSMTRAGLVSGLSLGAWYYGRKFHPLVLLPFAAAVTVLINPSYVWGDLGWQLSFTAFGGVMIVAPLLQRYFFGDKQPGTIRQILGETIAAQIATAPVLIAAFGQLSNVAIPANLAVLPLVPLAMLLTFVAGIGALIVPPLAMVIGLPTQWLLGYMVWVSEGLAKLPWAETPVTLNWVGVVLCYGGLAAVCVYLARVTKLRLRDSNMVE